MCISKINTIENKTLNGCLESFFFINQIFNIFNSISYYKIKRYYLTKKRLNVDFSSIKELFQIRYTKNYLRWIKLMKFLLNISILFNIVYFLVYHFLLFSLVILEFFSFFPIMLNQNYEHKMIALLFFINILRIYKNLSLFWNNRK